MSGSLASTRGCLARVLDVLPDLLLSEHLEPFLRLAHRAPRILLCTDYDGTLVPFFPTPEQTATPSTVLGVLSRLSRYLTVEAAVISGRPLKDLDRLLPVSNLIKAGLHGMEISFSDGEEYIWPKAEALLPVMAQIKSHLAELAATYDGVLVEDKKYAVALHYRRYPGPDEEIHNRFSLQAHRFGWDSMPDVELLWGDRVIEVRPKGPNKGEALKAIRERSRLADIPPPLTIYIGDDTTDEDAFAVLKDEEYSYPIIVTENTTPNTAAQFRLAAPCDVLRFLQHLETASRKRSVS
ncbi:MAG: trehalose-phosphatase [Candidatus Bipolaricaulota bacterium]|nr:trehalose-phosphatase [Candidatus Bipolaricaulota bacterium]